MSEYDKQQWRAQQAARDAALEKQREKERKARERSARNAKRKLERLHRTLSEQGAITDFEDEFGESVTQRLEDFGSAFHDLEKGRPGDALSFAQKRVVAEMNKKAKDLKAKKRAAAVSDEGEDDVPARQEVRRYSSFKPKGKPKYTPRVRHIEDDMPCDEAPIRVAKLNAAVHDDNANFKPVYIPPYKPSEARAEEPSAKRPFLRVVR